MNSRMGLALMEAVIVLALGVLFVIACVGIVQSYRAEPAVIECRKQGLDGERRTFRSAVTCVPRVGRGVDTLYLKSEAQ